MPLVCDLQGLWNLLIKLELVSETLEGLIKHRPSGLTSITSGSRSYSGLPKKNSLVPPLDSSRNSICFSPAKPRL